MTPVLPGSSVAIAGFTSHAAAASAFLVLILLLLMRGRARGIGLAFVGCLALTAAWAAVSALDGLRDAPPSTTAELIDALRIGGWLGFLGLLLVSTVPERSRVGLWCGLAALVMLHAVALLVERGWLGEPVAMALDDSQMTLVTRLALPIGGLLLIENLVRNAWRDGLWSGKFLFVALGAMWAYDLFIDADALLFRQAAPELIASRGAIQVLIVPLLAVAAARNPSWSLEIGVSRGAVFHSAALMGSGMFLLFMAGAGYYLRQFGGSWGPLLQITFLAAAGILLAVVVTSGRARGQLNVFINKHFFSYKYDYRVEWHRFIDALGGDGRGAPLRERVIEAIADIMDSPGGAIWLRAPGASEFVATAAWNFPLGTDVEPAEGEFVRHLDSTERIVTVQRGLGEQNGEVVLPDWLAGTPQAWLVVPLKHHDRLLGILLLQRPRAPRSLDWEDWDLLRTVGPQAASYLAEPAAIQAVADARQLQAVNRRFALFVHDLKNL